MSNKEKVSLKSILNKFMEKSMQALISVVAEQSEHLISWIKNISGLKRKIRSMLLAVIFFTAGVGVLGVGIALYLADVFPDLGESTAHILVGLVIVLIGAIYIKSSE